MQQPEKDNAENNKETDKNHKWRAQWKNRKKFPNMKLR